MATLYKWQLNPAYYGDGFNYETDSARVDSIDAPTFIESGSMIKNTDGEVVHQYCIRGLDGVCIATIRDKKKRGRPATGTAKTGAQRVSKLRAKRNERGLCPCCGQPVTTPQ